MSRLSFARSEGHWNGYGALLRVYQRLIKCWFDFGIFRLLNTFHVEPHITLFGIARFYEMDWDALKVTLGFRMLMLWGPLSAFGSQQR